MAQWWWKRYKPGSFRKGQKSTCRVCQTEIFFVEDENDNYKTKRQSGVWLHDPSVFGQFGEDGRNMHDTMDHNALPKDFCEWPTSSGTSYDYCGRPVKYEDQEGGHHACGIHMKNQLEDEARKARAARDAEEREQIEMIKKYEAAQYQEAADWLVANGYEHLIATKTRDGAFIDRYSPTDRYASRIKRDYPIDVHELCDVIRSLTEAKEVTDEVAG